MEPVDGVAVVAVVAVEAVVFGWLVVADSPPLSTNSKRLHASNWPG